MFVYVRNSDGQDLMPCTPSKARKLLHAEKAKIVNYRPFTIQLDWQCEGKTQAVTCGIDKGSSITGIACVGNDVVLLAAEIHHRQDVKAKMEDRRERRKSRRAPLVPPSAVPQPRVEQVQRAPAAVHQDQCGRGDPRGSTSSSSHLINGY